VGVSRQNWELETRKWDKNGVLQTQSMRRVLTGREVVREPRISKTSGVTTPSISRKGFKTRGK
jgi:hypothetical protein